MGPFGKLAPAYWKKGLSVIPLTPRSKQPARGLTNWTGYCNNLPSLSKRAKWLQDYAACGIGLCLSTDISPSRRIGAVDIDDDRYVRLVEAIVGPTVSGKRGKKGKTLFVTYDKAAALKSRKVFAADRTGGIDLLLAGRMTVLPPSDHPETGKPYQDCGQPLLDIDLDHLPTLDERQCDLLELAIGSEESMQLMSGSDTHVPGLAFAAKLVRFGCDRNEIEAIFRALLPLGYSGNTLEELAEWYESAHEKGFAPGAKRRAGNSKQPTESEIATNSTLQMLDQLFHDEGKRAYMTVRGKNSVRHLAVRSTEAELWIGLEYFRRSGRPLSEKMRGEIQNVLDAKGRFEGDLIQPDLRIGGDLDTVFIDLGNDCGELVRIDADGWQICLDPSRKFYRSPGCAALPRPTRGGTLEDLRILLGLDGDNWKSVWAALLTMLRPRPPYMMLLVEGMQGSGKSMLCETIKRIVDPNQVLKARLPNTEENLNIHAQDWFLLSYDIPQE